MDAMPVVEIAVLSESLERYLIAIEGEIKHGNHLLERLVALEEERREGERGMEALAESLMPGKAEADVDQIDWFRRDGALLVREGGIERAPTQDEARALSAIGAVKVRRR